jgi:Spy/CpxP family protein refolding chaperone
MMKKYIFMIVPLLVFTVFAGCNRKPPERGFFRPHHREGHPGRGKEDISDFGPFRIDKMAEDLNLSKAQLDTLEKFEKELMEKHFEMRKNREQEENIKAKITEMVRKDSLSKEEILEFMNKLHSLREECRIEIDSFTAEKLAKMHSVLTKEQREKLAKKLEEFKPKREFEPERDRK